MRTRHIGAQVIAVCVVLLHWRLVLHDYEGERRAAHVEGVERCVRVSDELCRVVRSVRVRRVDLMKIPRTT